MKTIAASVGTAVGFFLLTPANGASFQITECNVSRTSVGEWVLEVSAKNAAKDSVTINSSDLPWAMRSNIELVAIPIGDGAAPLTQVFFIDDPRVGQVTIASGEKVSGTVNLTQRFPDLASTASRTNVLVAWKVRSQAEPRFGSALVGPSPSCRLF